MDDDPNYNTDEEYQSTCLEGQKLVLEKKSRTKNEHQELGGKIRTRLVKKRTREEHKLFGRKKIKTMSVR